MIKHIVMWKLAQTAENKSKNENAKIVKELIEALQKVIPQIHKIEVGINFNDSDAAFDVVLYSEFKTEADLEIYQDHPEHKKVAAFIGKIRTDRAVADYIM
jgi:hypothetical protein